MRKPQQAERDRLHREQLLARLREELRNLKYLPDGQHTGAVCALRGHPAYGRFLKQFADGRLVIDRANVKAAERLDGKYLLRTSDDTLSAEDVALGYKQLIEIEDAFRTLKQTLELRPVYPGLKTGSAPTSSSAGWPCCPCAWPRTRPARLGAGFAPRCSAFTWRTSSPRMAG